MQIIAKRGSQYLVTEQDPNDTGSEGFIVDLNQKLKSDSMRIQGILRLGYWRRVSELPDETLLEIQNIYA